MSQILKQCDEQLQQPVVMQTLPLAFVKWYSGMEEQKILKAYERWKKESGIVSVASEGQEKSVCADGCSPDDITMRYGIKQCRACGKPV